VRTLRSPRSTLALPVLAVLSVFALAAPTNQCSSRPAPTPGAPAAPPNAPAGPPPNAPEPPLAPGPPPTIPEPRATPLPVPTATVANAFAGSVRPILSKRCDPCHNPGGKMYDKLPFDDAATVASHRPGVLKRLKEPDEKKIVESWFDGLAASASPAAATPTG